MLSVIVISSKPVLPDSFVIKPKHMRLYCGTLLQILTMQRVWVRRRNGMLRNTATSMSCYRGGLSFMWMFWPRAAQIDALI
ncbi:MAG: hypothetical protein BGO00_06130 [Alphaproteobacteria bacterium 62-8]|nr:MAG: hypothetical protein BGO00_06130 [Alphaproteobacteria bacterium 62-8]